MSGLIALCHTGEARMSVDSLRRTLGPRQLATSYRCLESQGRRFELGQASTTEPAAAPARSEDQRWMLVVDSAIANLQVLRDYLRLRHHVIVSDARDATTLVELIARDGLRSTLERLDGPFSLVALDRATGTLYAARDAVGSRPLYFIAENQVIGFSSVIRGLTAHGLRCGEPDPLALASYLQLRQVPSDRSLLSRLRRVPAGTLLTWHGGRISQKAFRFNDASTGTASVVSDPVQQFGRLLERSVREQLQGGLPAGVILDGSLESIVLAATLKRIGVETPCYSLHYGGGFGGESGGGFGESGPLDNLDSLARAARITEALGLPHRPLHLEVEDLLAADRRVVDPLEAPAASSAALAFWNLCQFASAEVPVLLGSPGAGTPLGGARRHRVEALRQRLPKLSRPGLRRGAALVDRASTGRLGQSRRALHTLGQADWLSSYVAVREVFRPAEIDAFGAGPVADPVRLFSPWLRQLNRFASGRSDLHRSLWLDTRTRLPDIQIPGLTKIAQSHRIELRLPYLAAPLLALLERLEDNWRTTPREGHRLLRASARQWLPGALARQPTQAARPPNLFLQPRFVNNSQQRVALHLGSALGWKIDPMMAVLARAGRGGMAESRAWTLHALARWLESVAEANVSTRPMPLHARGPGIDADITS